jgi:ABC-type transporter Mla subunit MlaD
MSPVLYHMKRFILPLAIGLVVLSGCSASKSEDAGTSSGSRSENLKEGAPQQQQPAGAPDQAGQPDAPPKDTDADTTQPTSAPLDSRSLIFRADISVRVDDVPKAADALTALATTAGGFVASEKRAIDSNESHATITVRVPSKQYGDTLEKVAKLGRELNRGSNVEDVTVAVVDLDTRIAAQRASVESVRRMFERASTLQDVVLLEKELNQRQAELASLEQKKRRLDDLVALSTITVTLVGPNTVITPEHAPEANFLSALKDGWNALVKALRLASVVFGYILPFLLIFGIPVFLLLWLVRIRNRGIRPPAA